MRPGDEVEIFNYPTHDHPDGGICKECDLNGLTGTIREIGDIYVKVEVNDLPEALEGVALFLPTEIRPLTIPRA